jgi:hypothetical protein
MYQYGETVVICGREWHAVPSAYLDGFQKKPVTDGRVHCPYYANIPYPAWQSFPRLTPERTFFREALSSTSMRQHLLESIATTIRDYRQGEVPVPSPGHVDRWVRQFDASIQEPMLAELDHVLKNCYLSHEHFLRFLRALAGRKKLIEPSGFWQNLHAALVRFIDFVRQGKPTKTASASYWRDVHLLEIQKHGASQHEMLRLFTEILAQEHGLILAAGKSNVGPFLYLDDILFTGNRIIADLRQWIQADAPRRADVVVGVIASYRRGLWYTHKTVLQAARHAGKAIRLHWLPSMEFEDRHWATTCRDCFHPRLIPDTPLARAYLGELADAGFFPRLRIPGSEGESRLFSSEAGRHLLEQQFLLAGLKRSADCPTWRAAIR